MSFNHFRIVVVVLACFGPFFAYICRLNLSLTIDSMVIKNEVELNSSHGYYEIDEIPSPSIQTEEHTLAWISRSSTRRIVLLSSKDTKKSPRRFSRLEKSPFSVLSIDFDANPGLTNGNKTDKHNVNPSNTTSNKETQQEQPFIQVASKSSPHLLHWSQEDRNDLLGAFFIGYMISQIPGARAAEMFGAKSFYILANLGSGLCSLAFPFASKYSTNIIYAYVVRIIMGASQGALFPTGYVFICEWLPKSERSQWLSMPSSLSRIGTIVMNLLVPIIMVHYNWEMVFYISGVLAILWTTVFMIFGSNSPNQSFWISKQELAYIESHMEPRATSTMCPDPPACITASGFSLNEMPLKEVSQQSAYPPVSWMKMITNKAMIILTIAMFVSEWSNMLLLIKLPGFLGPVLKMDIAEIGFWSSCLIGVYSFHCPFSGILAGKIEAQEFDWLDSLRVRKLFEIVAHSLQAIGCLMIAFNDGKAVILTALFFMMIGRATVGGGQCLMPPELSKEYPGTVFAFANTIANVGGVIGPMAVNWLVADPNEHSSWFNLWIVSALLFSASGIIFCTFADNRPQNFCRKPKSKGPTKALSQAQLTFDKNPQQIIKMDAFSRIANEPNPVVLNGSSKKQLG